MSESFLTNGTTSGCSEGRMFNYANACASNGPGNSNGVVPSFNIMMPNYSPETTVAITLRHFEKESKGQAEQEYDTEHGPPAPPLPDDDPTIDPKVRAIHKKRRKVRSAIVSRRKTAVYLEKLEAELQSRDQVNASLAKRLAVYHEVIADIKNKIGAMQRTIQTKNQLKNQLDRNHHLPQIGEQQFSQNQQLNLSFGYDMNLQQQQQQHAVQHQHNDITSNEIANSGFDVGALSSNDVPVETQLQMSMQMSMPLPPQMLDTCNNQYEHHDMDVNTTTISTTTLNANTPSSITAIPHSNSPFFLDYTGYDEKPATAAATTTAAQAQVAANTITTNSTTTATLSLSQLTTAYDSTISVEEMDGTHDDMNQIDNHIESTINADSFALETHKMLMEKDVHDYSSECSDGILSPITRPQCAYVITPDIHAFV